MTPQLIIDELTNIDPTKKIERVFVYGTVSWIHTGYVDVCLMAGQRSKDVRFLTSMIRYERDSPCTALIEVPKGLIEAFDLVMVVLDDDHVARRKKHVAEYNSPKAAPATGEWKTERIGSVRI